MGQENCQIKAKNDAVPGVEGPRQRGLKSKDRKKNVHNVNKPTVQNALTCVYTNADCLSNKLDELKLMVADLEPKVLGITEVKPKNQRFKMKTAEIAIEDYEIFQKNVENDTGRGIALYIHKSLTAVPYQPDTDFNEAIFVNINLKEGDKLLIGCIYRSGSGSEENNANLRKLIKEVNSVGYSHLMLMGDFNYPGIDWKGLKSKSTEEFNFVEGMRDAFLFQHVQEPTRGRNGNQSNILDLILTNEEGMVENIDYLSPIGKSDHSVLSFGLTCYTETEDMIKERICYDKADFTGMNEELMEIDWKARFKDHEEDVDGKLEIFMNTLNEIGKKFIPRKMISTNARRKGKHPVDHKVLKLIKKKHTMWKRYMETRDGEKYSEYCRLRNKVRSLTRKIRKKFEEELASNVKKNPKAMWKYIKSKCNTKDRVSELNTDPSNKNSPLTKSDQEKAEVLANFFSSVFTIEPPGETPKADICESAAEMPPLEITKDTVEKALKNLKVSKSPGPDGAHPRVLKELAGSLASPLADIYRTSLETSCVPVEWKKAKISAIFKKGSKTQAGNYRPVSLTSVLCKIMEGIVRNHIMQHMKDNKAFSKKQFGFISGRSTTLQLLHVIDKWTRAIDEGNAVDAIYLDFKKAFDTVPHRRLLDKLLAYNIKDPIQSWIKSFLSDRIQQVVVNGSESTWMEVTSGIPQGSVLGPILFVIYINDLPDCVMSDTYLFADDTKIFRTILDEDDANILQRDLNELAEWSNKWLLRFHPDKCVKMSFGKPRAGCHEYHIVADDKNHKIAQSKEEKDIGVIIDEGLKFEQHITEKVNKANSMFAIIRRAFNTLNQKNFIPLYKAMVRSQLDYAAPVWSPHKKKLITIIENVQRRATKQIPGFKDLSYQERLMKLKLPTLAYRRIRGDMIEVYKILHEVYDGDTGNLLILRSDVVQREEGRGHSKKLFQQGARLEVRKNCFLVRVTSTWNSLPEQVVESPTVNTFKARLDKYWKDQPLLYDYTAKIVTGSGSAQYNEEEDLTIEA